MRACLQIIFMVILLSVVAGCNTTMPPRPSGSSISTPVNPQTSHTPPSTSTPRVINIIPQAESEGNPTAGIDPNVPLETSVTPRTEPIVKGTTKPYVVNGETITPMSEISPFTQTGHASWYGKKFHGRRTASGEAYDMYKLTAAHKTLPIPSYVQVTNLDNRKSVVVRVNDRGPFGRPRIIDLSYAAAKQLDIIRHGSAQVEITLIDPSKSGIVQTESVPSTETLPVNEKSALTSPEEKGIYVQVGAFGQEENADRLKQRISNAKPETQTLINKVYNGKVFQVILGPYPDHALATQAASEMRDQLQLPALIFSR